MIRDVYLEARLRLHLPGGLVMLEPAPLGTTEGAPLSPQPLHVITAFNPHGQVATETDNRRSHRALVARLRSRNIRSYPAAGGDRAWHHVEPSLLVVGLPRSEAIALGKDFGQDAVFEWTLDALSVISCSNEDVVDLGWRRITPDARSAGADRAWRELGLESPYEPVAVASSALDRALESADPERTTLLHDVFAHLADDYWTPRVAAQDAAFERRKQREATEADAHRAAQGRREERRARQQASRRRNAARHAEHVRLGWPTTWRPLNVDRWIALGGDVESAQAWDEAGWPADEVVAVARAAGGTAEVHDVVGAPEHHAAFGDSLHDVVLGRWPAAPAATLVSVKRTFPDGRRERCFVLSIGDDGVRIVRLWRDTAGAWRESSAGAFPDVAAAFSEVRELSRVDADIVCEISAAPGLDVDLLGLLRAPRSGVDPEVDGSANGDAAEELGLDLDEIARVVDGVPSRLVHCTVDGVPVVAVRTGRGWRWLRVDPDGVDGGELVGEKVAEYRWFSESGGAPVSWDGGSSVQVVAPGLAVVRQWGDEGEQREYVTWPTTAARRAAVLADWIARLDLEAVTALVLEPWPSREKWLQWYDVSIWLELAVEDDVIDALRAGLARDGDYRLARHAVRHPRSRAGRALSVALEQAAGTGFTGDLYGGRWFASALASTSDGTAQPPAPSDGEVVS